MTTGLGAHLTSEGANFSVYAPQATAVELCLFDATGQQSIHWMQCDAGRWTVEIPGVGAGQRYGYRAHGPWDPSARRWFNPAKLLIDPYARAVTGDFIADGRASAAGIDGSPDDRDSAPVVPLSVVVADPAAGTPGPRTPWSETVIYEAHVKGLTARDPNVPEQLRGSYAGLAQPAVLDRIRQLGVTAIELMPVQQFVSEPALQHRGLRNYWGYNPVAWFAPHAAYAATGTPGGQVQEFADMASALHDAGLELICDVVFNHTAEQDGRGPMLSWRGLMDADAYRGGSGYRDDTGCGNSVIAYRDPMLSMILDCLRWWASLGVDGFRFDLAATLTRSEDDCVDDAPFLAAVAADPVLSRLKLIAEPWDLGPGGYRAGRFRPPWAEWNDSFRDDIRDYWRGAAGATEAATRIAGSADRFEATRRAATASINYLAAHDGLTLADLVAYEAKHNDANGEQGRDGRDDNRSVNHGVEGPTDDPAIHQARRRHQRALLATVMLSHGTPMIQAGDESSRTQDGNNNAYCHDSELTWLDHSRYGGADDLSQWVAALSALRREFKVLRPEQRRHGDRLPDGRPDIGWFDPAGHPVQHWGDDPLISLSLPSSAPGSSLHLVFNPGPARPVTLPPGSYERILDSADAETETVVADTEVSIAECSVVVFRLS